MDWNVINISKFVETEEPTMEQRKSKFYEEYLKTPNVISPWYRNIVPVQVIIFLSFALNTIFLAIPTCTKVLIV